MEGLVEEEEGRVKPLNNGQRGWWQEAWEGCKSRKGWLAGSEYKAHHWLDRRAKHLL